MAKLLQKPVAVKPQSADTLFFVIMVIVSLLALIWMAALVYRAYSVSCNIKGGKAIGSFIAGLIIAEILSKLGIWLLAAHTG